jgi:hypothetical protein
MTTHQGDLSLLQDPVAQQLLNSKLPCRLAYVWSDGTPRVVPINYHWNGAEIVIGGPPKAPKFKVLHPGSKVAITIDTDSMPYKVLLLRGTVRLVDEYPGLTPEYIAATYKTMGDEGAKGWLEVAGALTTTMRRIYITPEWAAVLDFEGRFPNALEELMEQAQGG